MKFFWLSLILGLFLACTNPFSTRGVQDPERGGDSGSKNNLQTDPDSLLAKMKYAFQFENVNYYQEILADSSQVGKNLIFVPQKDEKFRFTGWNLKDETNYFSNLINRANVKSVRLTFSHVQPWNTTPTSTDTVQSQMDYLITVQFRTKTEKYQGQSIFYLLRSPLSKWYIFRWEDLKLESSGSDSTWSTLKATFRYN